MRAKDEFRYIAKTYNTKLLLERVVDGKLMCPEACCGSPVLECKCGEDCEHCNCFMIQKAIKSNGLTDKLLKEFYKMRDPDGDGSWPDDEREEERRKNPDYGEPEYQDTDGEYGEDNEDIIGTMVTWNQDGPMKGEVVDVDIEQGFAVVETGFGSPAEKYVVELGELTKATPRKPRSTITRSPAEENEENTHKESYTNNYLSEQKSSDKRNIKPKTKNQSFKERFKPKTHWQLEELRRMGL